MTFAEQLQNVENVPPEEQSNIFRYVNGVISRGTETEFGVWVDFRLKELENLLHHQLYQVDDNAKRALRQAWARL